MSRSARADRLESVPLGRLGRGPLPPLSLVLGGARSGKSRLAEALVAARGPGLYLATATADDAEMAARIAAHRARRAAGWRTLEEPLALPEALAAHGTGRRPILVECLTLWLANLMAAGREVAAETDRLLAALAGLAAPVVLVSNEVGLGIVPEGALARRFRDEAGRLHQRLAARADWVIFVAAGLPLVLKPAPGPGAAG